MKHLLPCLFLLILGANSSAQFTPIHPNGLRSVGYSDFNGDALVDVVGIDQTNGDVVLIAGNEFDEFDSAIVLSTIEPSDSYLATEDFDSDGDIDLIATTTVNIVIMINDGTGSFNLTSFDINNHLPIDWPPNNGLICSLYEAEFLDLNEDLILDLFLTISNCFTSEPPEMAMSEMLTLGIAGDGSGGLEDGNITSSFHQAPTTGFTVSKQIDKADLNNDGMEEFLILEDAEGQFEAQGLFGYLPDGITQYNLNAGETQYRFRLEDIDANGFVDAILLTENGLFVFYSDAGGVNNTGLELFSDTEGCIDFGIGDADNDGNEDVIGISDEGELVIYYGNDTGTFDLFTGLSQNAEAYYGIEILQGDGSAPDRILAFGTSSDIYQLGEVGSIQGAVYIDINGDMEFSTGDYIIPDMDVHINGGVILQSQPQEFSRFLTFGDYTVEIANVDETLWTTIAPSSYAFTLDTSNSIETGLYFGLVPNSNTYALIPTINSPAAQCAKTRTQTITVYNSGNTVLDGTISYSPDIQCAINEAPEADDIDFDNSIVTFSFQDLAINSEQDFLVTITYPGSGSIGDTLEHNMAVNTDTGLDVNETLSQELICSYDPNDKTEYNGWTDMGYISSQYPTLDYLIRFQNTGTDTAYQVIISDFLNPALDLSTVDIIASSHENRVEIDPSGGLLFIFENINLVDSIANEPESHGFIRFRVDLNDGLIDGTSITNSAVIFFDQNPPILTNTTTNTVIDCNSLGEFTENTTLPGTCFGDELLAEIDPTLVETISWTFDGSPQGDDTFISFLGGLDTGIYDIAVEISNPVCQVTREIQIEVFEPPLASIIESGPVNLTCETDFGVEFQWFENGISIDGATDQELILDGDDEGSYTVLATDTNGCSALSEALFFIANSISESGLISASISPNPATGQFRVSADELTGSHDISIYDLRGKKVLDIQNYLSGTWISIDNIQRSIYNVLIRDMNGRVIYSSVLSVE